MRCRLKVLTLLYFGGILIASSASAAAVINEILFDPAGTDTGLEKIEIYNPDAASQDMGGWELYPDGIGYFSFPAGFSLAAKSFAVIHLRTPGVNDAANLYHSTASANMGNSSGSLALFRSGERNKDTIIDFVRYHKPGASERKTWESAAVEAGLWTLGAFVDISAHAEGNSVGLISDGLRQNAASWKIYPAPSVGGANVVLSGGGQGQTATSTSASGSSPNLVGPPPTPSLGADAGPDAIVVAGAIVAFRGMAFGLDGEPLPSARFLWNFGDGRVQEGKSLNHVYYFPGTYQANLSVSSGEYTGSDWRMITVIPPELIISEVQPGDDGFIELFNASDEAINLSGINLEDDVKNIFRIPAGTVIGAEGVIVFANAISGLHPSKVFILRDARSSILDKAEFPAALPGGASWERAGERFVAASTPTPGKFNPKSGEPKTVYSAASIPPAPGVLLNSADGYSAKTDATAVAPPSSAAEAPQEQNPSETINPRAKPETFASMIGANAFLVASVILGLAAAAGFLIVKRRMF